LTSDNTTENYSVKAVRKQKYSTPQQTEVYKAGKEMTCFCFFNQNDKLYNKKIYSKNILPVTFPI